MRLSEIKLSFEKEMREVLRDKRALLITLLLPALVFPIFEITFALMAGSIAEQSATRVTRVCIVSKEDEKQQTQEEKQKSVSPLDSLKEEFRSSKRTKLLENVPPLAPEKMIIKGICDVVVKPNDEFSADVTACRMAKIQLYDNAYSAYMVDEQNVWDPIKKFADGRRAIRLADYKIPKEEIKPIDVSVKTVESAASRSAFWAAMVYTLMLIFVMTVSSMYPALDVITGERERGTLILLLMAPGDRRSYVCGKLLTVTAVTLMGAILTLISVTVSLPFIISTTRDLAGSFKLSLPIGNLLLSSIFLFPVALTISAASILISSYARTFQQGQSYFAPLILVSVLGCGIVLSCESSAPFFVNLVPVVNLMLCLYRAIQGQWNIAEILAAIISSAAYLALVISASVGILDREESLFGIKQAPSQKTSFAKEAFITYGVCLALFFYVMPVLQTSIPLWGLIIAQIVTVGLPAFIAPKLLKMPVMQTLSLRRPSMWSAAGAIMLAPSLALLSSLIAQLQSSIMPDSENYIKALQDYLIPKGSEAWIGYITIAVGPAVCEELFFRGALQGMLRRSFSTPMVVSVIAVLFGIMHGSSYRFLPTSIMGLLLAIMTEYTGSLFPSILLHASNNALAVYEAAAKQEPSPTIITVAILLGIAGIFCLYKGRKK